MRANFGRVLKADHAQIPQVKRGTGFDLHFALMNEFHLLIAQVIVEGTGTLELKKLFERIRQRYDEAGELLPLYVYLDCLCCPGGLKPCSEAQRRNTKTMQLYMILNPEIKLLLDLLHWMKRFDEGLLPEHDFIGIIHSAHLIFHLSLFIPTIKYYTTYISKLMLRTSSAR